MTRVLGGFKFLIPGFLGVEKFASIFFLGGGGGGGWRDLSRDYYCALFCE